MKRQSLWFEGAGRVSLREETLEQPDRGEILLESIVSAISPGTEMLVYKGQLEQGAAVDTTLQGYRRGLSYPLRYGYASVGRIVKAGDGVDPNLVGRLAFAFMPHASASCVPADLAIIVPDGIAPEEAAFLASAETAVNLVQDGAPLLGERVLVCGQGIVGLLTAALLAEFPLETLVTCDPYARRRAASSALGATASLDPGAPDFQTQVRALMNGGADLSYELSGAPAALDQAIGLTAFSGRVVIGSWYGKKRASLDLGGDFHRSRLRLISSQVSSIAPELSGRWDKPRRFAVAWNALRRIRPEKWITHRFPLVAAADAYRLLDEAPSEAIQVIFHHREL